ncbi:MAG: hypothetical protein RIC30_09345 [Marinoscillum sp.]|uniref:hypothetical protein n=1 Tax=Marinoscillum sp. TaxID=2024838 RepID=UPI003304E9CF
MNVINGAIPQLKRMAVTEHDPTGDLTTFDPIAAGEKQHGRIVTIVAVKTGTDISGWDALDEAGWEALILAKDIHVIGPIQGELPDPSETTSPGDGHQEEVSDGEVYDIPFDCFNPDDNMLLAEKLNKQSQQNLWSIMIVFYDMTGYVYTSNGIELVPVKYRLRPVSNGREIRSNRKMMSNVKFSVNTLPKVLPALPVSVFKKN